MAIRFRCQHCSGLMSISNRQAGAMVPCATCGEQTLVPLEDIFAAAGAVSPPPQPPSPIVPAATPPLESPPRQDTEPLGAVAASQPLPPREIESPAPDDVASDRDVASDGDEVDAEAESDDSPTDDVDDDEAPPLALRRQKRIDDDMDLTPMVDVTFQLLIFFMVTASFAMQKSIQVPTPDPDQKGATQQMQTLDDLQGTSILVKIDATNAILIDDEPLADPSQLIDVLRDKMRKEQKTELLLTAHTAALHRGVIAVIDAANEVGMQKIRLA